MGLCTGSKHFRFSGLVLIAATVMQPIAQSEPLRKSSELWLPKAETFVRVTGARIVIADYKLIREDFSATATMSESEIDHWLLAETAFISVPQASQSIANTAISTTKETRLAFRPKEYRRGSVFAVEGGLIDAKGTGSVDPEPKSHENGLASLGEVIREYAYEKLVHRIFQAMKSPFTTVGSYAVIDYGFDIIHDDARHSRAGFILRQAHTREWPGAIDTHSLNRNSATFIPPKVAIEIEYLLRKFGITSAGASQGDHGDLINLQGTKDGAIVDFGAFLNLDSFNRFVVVRNQAKFLTFFEKISGGRRAPFYNRMVWSPETSPQPDPDVRIPTSMWGTTETGVADPSYDNPYIWSHRLAEDFAQGRANRHDVYQHYQNLMKPAEDQLAKLAFVGFPRTCESVF